MTDEAADSFRLIGFADKTQSNSFALDQKFKPSGLVTGVEATKGGLETYCAVFTVPSLNIREVITPAMATRLTGPICQTRVNSLTDEGGLR